MARRLVNELTWSVSRAKQFEACERAYYYHYYGSWGGWEDAADPRTRQLYVLKNIKTLPMWAGQIVHEVIAETLRRYALHRQEIKTGELQARARGKLRSGWVEAVERQWQRRPKKTNLHELYYGNGKSLRPDKTDAVKQRVYNCLEAFCESDILKEMLAASYLNWKPVDTLDSFVLDGGLKIWCAVDFAFVDPAGTVRVIDWKTGAERGDDVSLQLACYAMYAQQKWHAPLESQQLAAVFLPENARVSVYSTAPEDVVEAKDKILNSTAAMRSRLVDVAGNQAREEDFSTCGDERICRNCNFREICLPETS